MDRVLAFALLLAVTALVAGPVAVPASALHVCIDGPCDHGVVDDAIEKHLLLRKVVCFVTGDAWGPQCG